MPSQLSFNASSSAAFAVDLQNSVVRSLQEYSQSLVSSGRFGCTASEKHKTWFPNTRPGSEVQNTEYAYAVAYMLLLEMKNRNCIPGGLWRLEGCKGSFCLTRLVTALGNPPFFREENLCDMTVVVDTKAKELWFAAELELGKQSKDGKKGKDKEDGRERDFRKLLNCTAAVKLFVCRVQGKDPSPVDYCKHLEKLVAAHGKLLATRGTTNPCLFGIVVLPTTAEKWKDTCLTVIARDLDGNESLERTGAFQGHEIKAVKTGRPSKK